MPSDDSAETIDREIETREDGLELLSDVHNMLAEVAPRTDLPHTVRVTVEVESDAE